jgi:hypothetical protein
MLVEPNRNPESKRESKTLRPLFYAKSKWKRWIVKMEEQLLVNTE